MCGIAGMFDLAGRRTAPESVLRRMASAIIHRGPDEEGYLVSSGVGLANRRLSIVDLAEGQQPMTNETQDVFVVFNGELFDHVEKREELKSRGHRLKTHCDTEIIPHMWEETQEGMYERLRGQFAIACWDEKRRIFTLGRDRFGIAPLYWTRQDDWLLFASEIKGLLASGMVTPKPDLRGIDHIFTFSALPGPITCFEGVQLLPPGHFLHVTPESSGSFRLTEKAYWKMNFPDAGQEERGENPKKVVDEFEQIMLRSVSERLRADVPVGAYLSGGVDSSMIVALSCHLKGAAINTYTIRVDSPDLDELDAANSVARHVGTKPPIVQEFRAEENLSAYPELIRAVEAPVIDTSCAALLLLASRVHANGQKVVLTGEGSDEWLVGYPWYKAHKIFNYMDMIPGLKLSEIARRAFLRLNKVPQFPRAFRRRQEASIGGPNAWIDSYGLLGLSKLRFYGEPMREILASRNPWDDLGFDLERAKKWNPLNRGIWIAARVTLAGHLLQGKGDRVSMNSSVEGRFPFLDEDVFDFTAKLDPSWKLKGFRDKHLLRLLAERWLPPHIFKRGKVIFRAPLDSFHVQSAPYVEELLSDESLKKTGYFNIKEVRQWRQNFKNLKVGSLPRLSVEMGLAAVVATQLWHQQYIDSSIANLPAKMTGLSK